MKKKQGSDVIWSVVIYVISAFYDEAIWCRSGGECQQGSLFHTNEGAWQENLNPEILLNLPTLHCMVEFNCEWANFKWVCGRWEQPGFPLRPPEVEPMVFTCCCTGDPLTSSHRNPLFKKKRSQADRETKTTGRGSWSNMWKKPKPKNTVRRDIWLNPKQNPTSPNTKHSYFKLGGETWKIVRGEFPFLSKRTLSKTGWVT